MRNSVAAAGAAVPLLIGMAIGAMLPRWSALELEIARGGRAFMVNRTVHRLPGIVSAERDQMVVVTNRDTVDRLVGVALVPAGWRVTVPLEYCTGAGGGAGTTLIVR